MKELKLKELEKSFEEGIINKEEYEKKKVEIEAMPEKKTEEKKESEYVKLRTDKTLIVAAVIVILVFALILGLKYITPKPPETIDELHELNLKGKLKPEQGYLYRDVYSFVKSFLFLCFPSFQSSILPSWMRKENSPYSIPLAIARRSSASIASISNFSCSSIVIIAY